MQKELIRSFVRDTNHQMICGLPGIAGAVSGVNSGSEWSVILTVQGKHTSVVDGIIYPKLIVTRSPGKDEQIFKMVTNKDEHIWVYPDNVYIGDKEVYSRDMFLDPASPTDEEAAMLRMTKGVDFDLLMKKFGRFPGRLLERILSGKLVEQYVSANKEKVIVLSA
ncbi:hypothetical protein [Salmonella phage SSE121]|uniref:Uncharacterized protein n=2 Tax=Seunavirus TaxID=1914851 RepID=K4I1L4_9CAUD|nr:hypothetical protein ACQ19_gp155 [Salmonella phage SSE121]AFU63796.1 hypothetical protein [Salmonella phage SSE121]QXL90482.1 hypothetical protein [Salmonella phage NINP13076]